MTLPSSELTLETLIADRGGLQPIPTQEDVRAALKTYFKEARRALGQSADWRIPIHPEGTPQFRLFAVDGPRSKSDQTVDKLIQRLAVYYFYTDHRPYLDKLVDLMMVRLMSIRYCRN